MFLQVSILLNYPFLYKWKNEDHIHLLMNTNSDDCFKLFSKISCEEDAFELLNNIDEKFAVVINSPDYIFAAVDRVRSFPLFYKIENKKLIITDVIAEAENEFIFDQASNIAFLKKFYTEDSHTLLLNWKQLQPGEFFFINSKTAELIPKQYFHFKNTYPAKELDASELKNIYLNVFESILNKADDKTIIIPLSGGYDSRCIAAVLKLLNAKNIFAYTYGTKESAEKQIAEKVAGELKLNWHFVEYSQQLLNAFFTEEWRDYSLKNHHFSSLPPEQDFFALCYLKKNNLLPGNGIVLPGFLGDYFAGSMFKNQLEKNLSDSYQDNYISNRGCKLILNTVRLYEYFGMEWEVPFASKFILEYWLAISLKQRFIENGYNDFLSDTFFKPLNIDFKKKDHFYKSNSYKNFVKNNLPEKVIKYISSKKIFNAANDPNNTRYLFMKIRQVLQDEANEDSFNEIYARFFLRELQSRYS